MKIYKTFILLLMVSFVIFSCKKNVPLTPQEKLEGKWIVTNSNILGANISGDGSYLTFNTYSSTGSSGIDSNASDHSTGIFTYGLNESATILTIADNSVNGGSWNAAWDVLELTETQLKITSSTILGNLTVIYNK